MCLYGCSPNPFRRPRGLARRPLPFLLHPAAPPPLSFQLLWYSRFQAGWLHNQPMVVTLRSAHFMPEPSFATLQFALSISATDDCTSMLTIWCEQLGMDTVAGFLNVVPAHRVHGSGCPCRWLHPGPGSKWDWKEPLKITELCKFTCQGEAVRTRQQNRKMTDIRAHCCLKMAVLPAKGTKRLWAAG